MSRRGKSIEQGSRLTVALDKGRIRGGILNTIKLHCGDGVTMVKIYKWVTIMAIKYFSIQL